MGIIKGLTMPATPPLFNPTATPLRAMLGLNQGNTTPNAQDKFFFASPLLSQRLAILENMVSGRASVVTVVGERGSGKTTLMHRYIAGAGRRWHSGRIRLKTKSRRPFQAWRNLNNRMVFFSENNSRPSVIIDDAHQLSPQEIKTLLRWAFPSTGAHKLQSIVLLAEPRLRERYADMARWLPPQSVIDKIHMTPLTESQTADYLQHRIRTAGFSKLPFSKDEIRTIYQLSSGLPGWINGEAYMLLKKMKRRLPCASKLQRWTMRFSAKIKCFNKWTLLFKH